MLKTPSSRFADPHDAVMAFGKVLGLADGVLARHATRARLEPEEARGV